MKTLQRLFTVAVLASGAIFPVGRSASAQGTDESGVPAPLFGGAPHFVAYTDAPVLQNREDVAEALQREYPRALSSQGIGGTVLIWLLIDEQGDIKSARLKGPSGHPALDATALRVAAHMRFAPGRYHEQPVMVWTQIPVIFRAERPVPASPPPAFNPISSQRPPFADDMPVTPPSTPASLLNGVYIRKQLRALFDKQNGDKAARGTAVLHLRIDIGGNATAAELTASSGNAALDSLALSLRPMLVFVPAIKSGRYAEGEATLPVRFPPQ